MFHRTSSLLNTLNMNTASGILRIACFGVCCSEGCVPILGVECIFIFSNYHETSMLNTEREITQGAPISPYSQVDTSLCANCQPHFLCGQERSLVVRNSSPYIWCGLLGAESKSKELCPQNTVKPLVEQPCNFSVDVRAFFFFFFNPICYLSWDRNWAHADNCNFFHLIWELKDDPFLPWEQQQWAEF